MSSPSTLSSNPAYSSVAIALHWLIALAVFVIVPLGAYMHDLPLSPSKLQLYSYHKSLGACILVLMLLRLVWRKTHQPPALPATMSAREQKIAHGIAHGMYFFLFTSPLTGWLMSSFFGKTVVVFGLLPLPDLVSPNESLGELFTTLHMISNFTLATLISLHILASLKHHFIDKDGVMARMVPWLGRK